MIGMRRSGKSTMCYQALHEAGLKYAYADFDDERLTSRNKEIALYSFSFVEFCRMKEVDLVRKTTKAETFRRATFDEYLKQGGFPELMWMEDANQLLCGGSASRGLQGGVPVYFAGTGGPFCAPERRVRGGRV